MELFKLIIFSTSLFLFGASAFFDTTLIYLFLNMTYKSRISHENTYDPMMILVNLINIMMHLIVYQFNYFVKAINKNQYGLMVTSAYNYLDDKVVRIKNLIFHWVVLLPMKFVMRKTLGSLMDESVVNAIKDMKINKSINENQQMPVIKRTPISKEIKLETNQDISNFLDSLMKENKKTN